MEKQPQFPAEEVTLPSKGRFYPKDSPLSKGVIEMKYMTAREEDILTNPNFIKKGNVIDKLLKSLIVTSGFKYEELLTGDKNAIMVAARILGYGAEYEIKRNHPETGQEAKATIDLSKIEDKPLDKDVIDSDNNEFNFTLPTTKTKITFKFLNQSDEGKIDKEIEGMQKINKRASEGLIRMKHTILSINGDYDSQTIRNFIDNNFLAKDARALRNYITKITPGIDMRVSVEFKDGYVEDDVFLPINLNFFWPDAGI